jgi:hypothetical protein
MQSLKRRFAAAPEGMAGQRKQAEGRRKKNSSRETPVKFLVSPNPKPQPVIAVSKSDSIISRDPDRPGSWVGSQPL